MSKSGQPATKADSGGQRVPKTKNEPATSDKKDQKASTPGKATPGKQPAP